MRGGGHNIAGNAIVDGGLVIDLSAMRSVQVAPQKQRAWVEGGALLRDVDHETQAYGLATPLGINSTTGVGGLTLGGGDAGNYTVTQPSTSADITPKNLTVTGITAANRRVGATA